jgi:2-polyprenyl-3-methyl-5-hydroxy-6-metoxy-1,4-benzoquinol methylase
MSLPARRVPYKPEKLWWTRAKTLARSRLHRFPPIEVPAMRIWRVGRFLLLRWRWKLAAFIGTLAGTYSLGVDVNKVCWVSPQRITYSSFREFELQEFKGRVIGGNWDRLEKRFEDLDVYVAFKQVFVDGRGWRQTVYYQRILDRISRGRLPWGWKDQSDLDRRCKDLESLFHEIRLKGYRTQREILLLQDSYHTPNAEDEVTVNIGRHGDLLFSDGAHRLAIAKLLDIQKIPVKIAVRHPEWTRFRKELLLYAEGEGGSTYQPLLHPDLDDILALHDHDDCEDRFLMVKQHMSVNQGRLLDIGANLGYFCHRFEDEGFDCYAVEDFPRHLYFMSRLKRAENKRFRIIAASVLECSEIRSMHFEVVLALNVFHHFLKTKDSYDRFLDLLKNLQTGELFFEPHLPGEPQMRDAYKNYAPDEFAEFLVQSSILENVDFIGIAKDGRSLYKLC